ncbi:MAG TPA: EVE domain-containing protein, partial [Rhodobacter sp.]|nr:EVE domain-containing protein [Rhodobacter sp.]
NYQARNNMRMMQLGDQGFFYHSNQGKEIVGVVAVCALSAPDSTTDDPRWDCIQLKAIAPLKRPVSLQSCKAHPNLQNMALVAFSRLSVQPVTKSEWDIIIAMSLT